MRSQDLNHERKYIPTTLKHEPMGDQLYPDIMTFTKVIPYYDGLLSVCSLTCLFLHEWSDLKNLGSSLCRKVNESMNSKLTEVAVVNKFTCHARFLLEAEVRLYFSFPLHLIGIWHEDRKAVKSAKQPWWTTDQFSAVWARLTWVGRQVREANGLALHLVWEAAQGDADLHLLCDVLVLVGWSLKHDADLAVHVCLGKLPTRLPRTSPEDDLYVICGSLTTWRAVLTNVYNV